MKKISAIFAIVGAALTVALIVAVIRFGAYNMRRVEADSVRWRMEWMSRR